LDGLKQSRTTMLKAIKIDICVPKKIMIVGCPPLLHRGLVCLLKELRSIKIYEPTVDYQNALTLTQIIEPELVIVDINMHEMQGLQMIKQFKKQHPDISILALCIHCDPFYEELALRAGASGYVSQSIEESNFLKAVESVLTGHTYMSSALRTYLSQKLKNGQGCISDNPRDILSKRELQVFYLIGQGIGTRELATKLNVSIKTVESHKEHIKKKLSLNTYHELSKSASFWYDKLS
jgi:DNA-binding NarL/FixJ family response regulator